MTVDELKEILEDFSIQGCGIKEVTANMEYIVYGAGYNESNDTIDLDCHI